MRTGQGVGRSDSDNFGGIHNCSDTDSIGAAASLWNFLQFFRFRAIPAVLLAGRATIRVLVFAAIATVFSLAWRQFNQVPLLAIGQPVTTGMLQREMEAPFFANLQRATGLPLKVTYKPLDSTGFKDTFQLQMLKENTVDLVSLRFIQNSQQEPGLLGIDLLGFSRDFAQARQVTAAYFPTVNRYLARTANARLLAVWTFGPQVLFCNKPIQGLKDVRGMKVRVANEANGIVFKELGAIPAVIPFDQTENALAIGLIDCAVTSAASANHAGWLKYAKVQFQLPIHFGINGYAITLDKWNALSPGQRQVLARTFKAYEQRLWSYSETLEAEVTRCNTGGPCRRANPYQLQLVRPSSEDFALLQEIARRKLLPAWGQSCERIHPGCLQEWRSTFQFHGQPRQSHPVSPAL